MSLVSVHDVLQFSRTDAAKEMLPPRAKKPSDLPGWYLVKLCLDDQTRWASNSEEQGPDGAFWAILQLVQDLLRDHNSAAGILEDSTPRLPSSMPR